MAYNPMPAIDIGALTDDPNGDKAIRVVVTAIIPQAPVLTLVTPGNLQNTLFWEPVAGAIDYIVYWATNPNVVLTSNKIITGSVNTNYNHTGILNGTTYYYRVVAVGPWGNTSLSPNELSGTPESYVNVKSILFDGIDEYLNFFDNHNFENNVPFSLSMWVKPTS